MKKFVAILLALITLFAVLGCQNAAVTKTAEPTQTPETTKAQEPDPAPTATPEIPKPSKSEDPRPVEKAYTPEEDTPKEVRYFEYDRVCDDSVPLDIPLYNTEDIVFYNYGVASIGISANAPVSSQMKIPPTSMYYVEKYFPRVAWRELENGYAYGVLDGTDGTRLYARYHYVQMGSDMEWRACGYPIYCKKTVSYSDFADIKVGDTSQKVAEVDPITRYYIRRFSRYSEENMQVLINFLNNPPCSVHLLTDGILKFTYERTGTEGNYVYTVTDIEYHDDYIMEAAGVTVDYSVADIDRIS